ncbi:MAG: methylated-DNA--[protein]-cysteine S-methyltransferase [Microbacterium sp.]
MTIHSSIFPVPLGAAVAVFTPEGLAALHLTTEPDDALRELSLQFHTVLTAQGATAASDALGRQLDEYFAGSLRRFDVALDWQLTSGFYRSALEAVCEIPYGVTAGYGEVATLAGRPRAARAVGSACRTTPFSLVVPVHRVVRSDGSIGGYGDLEHKRFLLALERDAPAQGG